MNKNEKFVFTINREVGTGGRTVGRKHGWWADFKRTLSIGQSASSSQYYKVEMGEEPDLLTTDEMYKAEKEILKGIAADESCVIAGRTAFHILKDQPNRLSILIQASMDHRIERVMSKQGMSREEAEKAIKRVDKMRENYVNKYTGTSRYDTRNYDLVISADDKTEDEIVDLILQYIG